MATSRRHNVIAGAVDVDAGSSNPKGLSEIRQTKGVKFAFVAPRKDGVLAAFHPLCKCRDYLTDILHCKPIKRSVAVHGMTVEWQDNMLDTSRTRLLLDFGEESNMAIFIANFPMLQRVEQDVFEIDELKLFSVKGHKRRLYMETDRLWQLATHRMSLLTLLCRAALYLESPEQSWLGIKSDGIDGQYIGYLNKFEVKKQLPLLKKIDTEASPTPSGFDPDREMYDVHDAGGLVNLICDGDQTKAQYGYSQRAVMEKNSFWKQLQELRAG